jgi:hypothetical protein
MDQISQDVPKHIALCEYDCRYAQCSSAKWEACNNRLQRGAGALMPLDSEAIKKTA